MRHRSKVAKLGREKQKRDAMIRSLVVSLFTHHSIKTTVEKAKRARLLAERAISLSKRGDLHSRRLTGSLLGDEKTVKHLWDEIVPVYKDRDGGYTRILRLGQRKGDGANLCMLELVDIEKVMRRKPKEE
ncbi:50S ribosomal protein L17 [candidate division WOR-3 bacterium JGI_Cruoil_03_44_89]|uniref:Large ribosomal subunit protein bL17 n=1 Tax=candidate division WOR-3 bacterium JGI_Cruoil_03_44_89 TaxID=1973748 RepID=A0A235BXX1_UNCW3|nr:MAG: 50S ribosomal protein L17 [candidate division WOR-3 bacterium JGI_Cruoil_03_44_89]